MFVVTQHLPLPAWQHFARSVYPWPYFAFYIQNLVLTDFGTLAMAVTWSLCIEEQFYLVWPFLVRLFRRLEFGLIGIMIAEPLLRLLLSRDGYSINTLLRLDSLAAGAIVALRPGWLKYGWAAIPVALWLLRVNDPVWGYSALALVFASALIHALNARRGLLFFGPLRYIGRISYGLYLTHALSFALYRRMPLYHLIRWNWLHLAFELALATGVAAISWHFFESPILKLRSLTESLPRAIPLTMPLTTAQADTVAHTVSLL